MFVFHTNTFFFNYFSSSMRDLSEKVFTGKSEIIFKKKFQIIQVWFLFLSEIIVEYS